MPDPGTWQFITNCQDVAQTGIDVMYSQILSSWYTIMKNPDLGQLSKYDFSVPIMPDVPTFTTDATYVEGKYQPHRGHIWEGTEMATVQSAIMSALSSGGIGISKPLQDSIFNVDRERKLQILSDALLMVDSGSGSKGFRMRGDYLAGQRNEVIQKYQFDMENLDREVTKLMEEHARTNWQFCIQHGISSEQFHANFTSKYDDLFVNMTVTALELYKSQLGADLQSYKAYVEGITLKWDVVKTRIGANTAALNAELERMKLELDIYYKQASIGVQSFASEAQRKVKAYDAYAKLVSSFAGTASGIQVTKA